MRIGRRLQSLGQVLEQAPARIVAKGFLSDASVTGDRPVVIEMDELRALFDEANGENVGVLLREYHEVLRAKRDGEASSA